MKCHQVGSKQKREVLREWIFSQLLMVGLFFFLLLLPNILAAESSSLVLPGSTEPGRIQQRFQPNPLPEVEPFPLTIDPSLLEDQKKKEIVLGKLREIVVEGVTIYSQEELRPLWEGYLGQDVSLEDIDQIAAAIQAKYHADGYIISQPLYSLHAILSGTVVFQVVENK